MAWNVRAAGHSVTGARPKNEDRYYVDPGQRLFLVADGMGGQQAGEQASQMAIDLLSQRLGPLAGELDEAAQRPRRFFSSGHRPDKPRATSSIQKAITEANGEIIALSQLDLRFHSMGTTLVLVLLAGRYAYVAGVGDSRVYLIRGRRIHQLTKDHSVAESLAEFGAISRDEVRRHRYRNVLWKYLGAKEASTKPDVYKLKLRRGDRLVLATDGLTGVVPDADIRALVTQHAEPQPLVEALVQTALDNNSHDNVTCLAVYVD